MMALCIIHFGSMVSREWSYSPQICIMKICYKWSGFESKWSSHEWQSYSYFDFVIVIQTTCRHL
jgi:hypothetical protein